MGNEADLSSRWQMLWMGIKITKRARMKTGHPRQHRVDPTRNEEQDDNGKKEEGT